MAGNRVQKRRRIDSDGHKWTTLFFNSASLPYCLANFFLLRSVFAFSFICYWGISLCLGFSGLSSPGFASFSSVLFCFFALLFYYSHNFSSSTPFSTLPTCHIHTTSSPSHQIFFFLPLFLSSTLLPI